MSLHSVQENDETKPLLVPGGSDNATLTPAQQSKRRWVLAQRWYVLIVFSATAFLQGYVPSLAPLEA